MNRIVCIGENSQGKSYFLKQYYKTNEDKSVYIESEQKADNELRNTADSCELMKFLNNFIKLEEAEENLNRQLEQLMSDFQYHKRVSVHLEADFLSLKNIVNVKSNSSKNHLGEPGSGDRFLAQLTLLKYMLSKSRQEEKSFDTLIIDEPERHFHLSIHYELGSILKDISNKGIKVIVASHSPEFVKGFIDDFDEIYYFKNLKYVKLDKKEKYLDKLTNGKYYGELRQQMSMWKQNLFENHDYASKYIDIFVREEFIHALFAPKIFLGEGYAEKMMYRLYKVD